MVCLLQKYYFTSQEIEIGKSGKTVNREFKQIATADADTAAGSKFPQK